MSGRNGIGTQVNLALQLMDRLLRGLHSSEPSGRTHISQCKRSIHKGARLGDRVP